MKLSLKVYHNLLKNSAYCLESSYQSKYLEGRDNTEVTDVAHFSRVLLPVRRLPLGLM
jgi:hypothetical protein